MTDSSSSVTFHRPVISETHGSITHVPGLAEVVRPLDDHGLGTECFELHDEMGEVELGLQVELDLHLLHTVLCLPPGEAAVPDSSGRGSGTLHRGERSDSVKRSTRTL